MQLRQHVLRLVFAEQIDAAAVDGLGQRRGLARIVEFVDQVDIVAPLLAPGRQQGMRMLVQQVIADLQRHAWLALLAAVLVAQQVFVGHDVRPMVAARIVHAQQHLTVPRQRCQRLQALRRHRRNTKHHHAARQPGRRLRRIGPEIQKLLVHGGTAGLHAGSAHILQQITPERRLPLLLGRQRRTAATGAAQHIPARGPVFQPIGAVDLVLVEHVGNTLGQLVALALVAVVQQKALQSGKSRLLQQRRQQAHQPPGERLLVERRNLGHALLAQHGAVSLPKKLRRQLHLDGSRHPAAPLRHRLRQRQLEPLRNAVALHQNGLRLQRPQRVALHPGHHQISQGFRMVAVDHHQAGRNGSGRGGGHKGSSLRQISRRH